MSINTWEGWTFSSDEDSQKFVSVSHVPVAVRIGSGCGTGELLCALESLSTAEGEEGASTSLRVTPREAGIATMSFVGRSLGMCLISTPQIDHGMPSS